MVVSKHKCRNLAVVGFASMRQPWTFYHFFFLLISRAKSYQVYRNKAAVDLKINLVGVKD